MAIRSKLVNLDAMIKREDFATSDADQSQFENVGTISLRDFTVGGLIGPSLRKPDFQRETNHWQAEQIVSLLECFVNGDLIPSVILWQSPTYLFVIDGGHRLSALRAWINDDYGDGPISQNFFNYEISDEQKNNAQKTRQMVNSRIGSWQHFSEKAQSDMVEPNERRRINAVISRGLPIQWVKGDADKAESSFFKINTKGTPLDDIEELLLKNRKKPISIASRAIIRAGSGHKYWSSFSQDIATKIEEHARNLHKILFSPEITTPIKTLDLPLGGPKGVRTAIQALMDLTLIAIKNEAGVPKSINDTEEDYCGDGTVKILEKTLALVQRVTGNGNGSLGLHPIVYFYGPAGRHYSPMFMGTMALIAAKMAHNDDNFFKKFTNVRAQLEELLLEKKDLISTIMQKHISTKRVGKYASLLDTIIDKLHDGDEPSDLDIVSISGLEGKVIVGDGRKSAEKFSETTKSSVFISAAFRSAIKCSICQGYLDPQKSISYDHINPLRNGGRGDIFNCALAHPYCNQAVKN